MNRPPVDPTGARRTTGAPAKLRAAAEACARALAVALAIALPLAAAAGPVERDRAKRIHDRLVGVPPDAATLQSMELDLIANNARGAALTAMSHPEFYTTALKDWVTPWTNESQTPIAPLNDYSATVIGIVRDGRDFREILSEDVVYVGDTNLTGARAYSHTDNFHYEDLERMHVDLSDASLFSDTSQSGLPNSQLQSAEAAGVITSRAAGEAFFQAGTNRRMWRFLAMNHLCRDMEQLHDLRRPADRVRQDVPRSPGGDSTVFLNQCVGCHSGMDPMAGAFAYFEWDPSLGFGRVVHTPGQVQPKYLINANHFPFGYITVDNRWDNYWRDGDYSSLGWRGPVPGGWGAKSLGIEVANSVAFSECKVTQVWRQVCFREPADPTERAEVVRIASQVFEPNYDIREVFASVAEYCMDD